MIPRHEVEIDPTIPSTATFWTPTADELEEDGAPGDFHNTELIETDIDEAEAIIEAEVEAVAYVDARSSTAHEFDELASAIEFEVPDAPSDEAPDFFEGDSWYGLNGLEIGVAGLVYALNAAGIVTAASCRSHHQGHKPWSDYPIVVFAASREQMVILQPLVESAGCGFEIDDVDRSHLVAIVAPAVTEMMTLARAVLLLGSEPHAGR